MKLGTVLLVVALAMAGCGGSEPFPTDVEANFMVGCTSGEFATTFHCSCVFNWLEDNVSLQEFLAEDTRFAVTGVMSNRLTDWFGEALVDCLGASGPSSPYTTEAMTPEPVYQTALAEAPDGQ